MTSFVGYVFYTYIAWCLIILESAGVKTVAPRKMLSMLQKVNASEIEEKINTSRRILFGHTISEGRNYMVYLKLPPSSKVQSHRRWLCGGVIIHDEYILTSAACIEDVKHFYVISGTYRNDIDDGWSDNCIKNGARKAIWKCIPRNYVFDGHENDNLRWMSNDIAIVKVDDEFDFERRIRGCDFIPKPIRYNNESETYEKPGIVSIIAGWGSLDNYNEWVNRRQATFPTNLMESKVLIIPKSNCKRRWGQRYHNIIDNYMICTKDNNPEPSDLCTEKYAECTEMLYSDETAGRRVIHPNTLLLHSANHNLTDFRRKTETGGFCENDHGGPLIYSSGPEPIVIGIISACLVKERTNRCYGPFLYTSVYKNRNLINCAIYKHIDREACNKVFRTSEVHIEEYISWVNHTDGPAKNEIKKEEEGQKKTKILEKIKDNI